MTERGDYYFLEEIFPQAGPELMRLLNGAAENAHLLQTDFFTIRDWLDIAQCTDCEEAHVLLILMLAALEEGSLCIEIAPDSLARRLDDLAPKSEANLWAGRVAATLTTAKLAALVGNDPHENKPLIRHSLGERQFLYFQKYFRAELEFQQEFERRLAVEANGDADRWPAIVRDVLADHPLRLDRDQQLALSAALLNNFTIISGGPGTGKTSIVLSLLRCLVRGGVSAERIALAAPTGRAAQRLSDAIRTDSPSRRTPRKNRAAATQGDHAASFARLPADAQRFHAAS